MPKKIVRRYDFPPANAGFGAPSAYSTPTGTGGDSGTGTTTGGDTTGGVFAPPDAPIVLAPTNLQVLSTDLSYSGVVGKWFVKIGWDAVDGASSYLLQWYRQGFGSFDNPVSVPTTTTSATFEVYMNGTYAVRVKAYSGGVESAWSVTLTFTAAIDPTIPDAPTGITAVFDDSGNILVNWTPATNTQLRDTLVDVFASAAFAGDPLIRHAVAGNSDVIALKEHLVIGGLTSAYVRLSSRSYAGVLSLPAYPATQPVFAIPAAPTGVTTAWNLQTGDMTLAWTPSARAVSYIVYVEGVQRPEQTGTRYQYSFAANTADHGGTSYLSLSYGVQGKDVFGRVGTQTTGTTTAPSPPTPTGGTADFDGPDALLRWAVSQPVAGFDLLIDSVAYATSATQYVYPFARNVADHSGTPDPVLTVQVRSRSILQDVSAWATFTATNPPPAAPTSVTATGYFSAIAIAASAVLPRDLLAVRYRSIKDGATLATIDKTDTQYTYTAPSSGTYQIGVQIVDVFQQASAEVLSGSVVMDILTISDLRAGMTYRDNLGTAASTLDRLKDDVRTSPGVAYTAR